TKTRGQAMIPFAADRAARWMISQMQPDGSLRGAPALDNYYKGPFGLITTGHIAEAERMLDHVTRALLREDGRLNGSGVEWYDEFCLYAHAWLAIAAAVGGRFELARPG